jgi:predicted DNA-binding protein (UPF0251 family)
MARPVKCRRVEQLPPYDRYKPAGVSCKNNKIMALTIDELEAMRLKDVEGLSQVECADRMQVSRQTFQLILEKARKTIVLAITQGYAIQIEGGNYATPEDLRGCGRRCARARTLEEKAEQCPFGRRVQEISKVQE